MTARIAVVLLSGTLAFPSARAAWVTEHTLERLGDVLPEDRVYYRWQSTASGENLDRLGVMNETTNKYFMSLKEGIAAGPGIYVAGTPWSSATYLPENGGNLLEMRVKKGTRFIDLMDLETARKMSQMKLKLSKLYTGRAPRNGVLIKYDEDYFVGKNLTGSSTFSLFPGPTATPEQLLSTYRSVRGPARAQVIEQIRSRRPDLVAELARDPKALDLALHVVSDADAEKLLSTRLAAELHPEERLLSWDTVSKHPDLLPRITANPTLRAQLATDMARVVQRHRENIASIPRGFEPLVEAVIDRDYMSVADRMAAARHLLFHYCENRELRAQPEKFLERVKLLYPHLRLHENEKRQLVRALTSLTTDLEVSLTPVPDFTELMHVADIEDYTLRRRWSHLNERHRLVVKAAQTRAAEDIYEVLHHAKNFYEVIQSTDLMQKMIPDQRMAAGARALVERHEAEYAEMISSSQNYTAATTFASRIGDKTLMDATYRIALEHGPEARSAYLYACASEVGCVGDLERRIRADGGRMLEDVQSYRDFVRKATFSLQHTSGAAEKLFAALIDTARTPEQFTRVADAFRYDSPAATKAKLFAAARGLGLNNLERDGLIDLANLAGRDLPLRREILSAAIDGAREPKDLIATAHMMMGEKGSGVALTAKLRSKMAELHPTAEDIAALKWVKLRAPYPYPRPAACPDCFRTLMRWWEE